MLSVELRNAGPAFRIIDLFSAMVPQGTHICLHGSVCHCLF